MAWTVSLHPDFDAELQKLDQSVQEEFAAQIITLAEFGPTLARPTVDTLNGSKHANMKELRFTMDGVWRFCFAFDPTKKAIVLCGGDKQGVASQRFYKSLIKKADDRYQKHLDTIAAELASARKAKRQTAKKRGT
jgi:hypothetical protein